ncbi:hypothetical protein DRW03_20330 [Corallococcus sp. H22C18031201]|uniref:hypothetical protein n=1 Tax=Citreicoccus inhibens TaxID=2849499 RepID=UPI000E730E72|nr:hypothetical protein [Citreicoccus inhibens]MBU8895683.1 hypothetical protein [Citreicoccus inhibens]RJS20110.1 hypothetical protein DRW03_20330 [Corallococcus sp. H22C18031201]
MKATQIPKPTLTQVGNTKLKARADPPKQPPPIIPPHTSSTAAPSHPPIALDSSAFSPAGAVSSSAKKPAAPTLHPQGPAPALAKGTRESKPLSIDKTACLTHGMSPDFVKDALSNGQLSSAYNRLGKSGKYSRDADRNGGGALGVYTRAVGTEQKGWKAEGYGVGSNADKVQLILSPNFLMKPGHTFEASSSGGGGTEAWRASSTDNMGLVPGAAKKDQVGLPKGDPLTRTKEMWGKQTESGRNDNFNTTVSGSDLKVQNEQLHWEKIPLKDNLKGMVCTSEASFNKMMQIPGSKRSQLKMPEGTGIQAMGTVFVGDQKIKVALTTPDSSMLSTLRASGIANSNNQVR